MVTSIEVRRSQAYLLWGMLLLYMLARFCQLYADRLPSLLIVILHVVPPAIFARVHGRILYRAKGMSIFAVFCLGFGAVAESLSLRTGFPFGHYYFTEVMGPKILQVPLFLALAYLGIGYVSWILALLILGYLDKPITGARVLALPLLASFIMLSWDPIHGPELVDVGPCVDMAGRRGLFRRATDQLLRLVSDCLSLLSGVCPLLQIQIGVYGAIVAELLERAHLSLWRLCCGQYAHSQTTDGSSCRH